MVDEKMHERRLQRIGQSLLVTLPKPWVDAFRLRKGATVRMLINERGTLTIAPGLVERTPLPPAIISYNNTFERTFFRAYFAGATTIHIRFQAKTKIAEHHAVRVFLRNFLNVHITDENAREITVAVFRIENLGIEACLRRIHLLSCTMIDEALERCNAQEMEQMELSLTQHYYLLVLLIRRFLDDGEYTKGDTLTLVRAMDMRMIAEKIERIADIVKTAHHINKRQLRSFRTWYAAVFAAFIAQRFDLSADLSSTTRSSDENVARMYDYGRGIAMLVR